MEQEMDIGGFERRLGEGDIPLPFQDLKHGE